MKKSRFSEQQMVNILREADWRPVAQTIRASTSYRNPLESPPEDDVYACKKASPSVESATKHWRAGEA